VEQHAFSIIVTKSDPRLSTSKNAITNHTTRATNRKLFIID
jgi:hypothetical protein